MKGTGKRVSNEIDIILEQKPPIYLQRLARITET